MKNCFKSCTPVGVHQIVLPDGGVLYQRGQQEGVAAVQLIRRIHEERLRAGEGELLGPTTFPRPAGASQKSQ